MVTDSLDFEAAFQESRDAVARHWEVPTAAVGGIHDKIPERVKAALNRQCRARADEAVRNTVAALARYTQHDATCQVFANRKLSCSCGVFKLLKPLDPLKCPNEQCAMGRLGGPGGGGCATCHIERFPEPSR